MISTMIQGTQERYCESPAFEISGSLDGFHILNLTHTQYLIHQIFYENHSLF